MDIIENKTSFNEKELLRVARRENNSKRGYVFVNALQAKHVPVSPEKPILLFKELGEVVKKAYPTEKILVIGFAETATAIGASVAEALGAGAYYLHTTREDIKDIQKIVEFREEHSHATEQILYCKDWEKIRSQINRILFVEDELTTGKTILNFVRALKENDLINSDAKLAVASVANAMDEICMSRFKEQDIDCHYLLKIKTDNREEQVLEMDTVSVCNRTEQTGIRHFKEKSFIGRINPRIGTELQVYQESCQALAEDTIKYIGKTNLSHKKVLVIGTEEFMYPAIKAAAKILNECEADSVKTHSTTRSPILPINHTEYPLKTRCSLKSFYCNERQTYIYNLEAYDYVVVMTDSEEETLGFSELCEALYSAGCNNIFLIKWVS